MTEQRRNQNRGRGNADAPQRPQHPDHKSRDAGAYIGRMPERATETIPDGLGPKDVRVAATATQPAPVRGDAGTGQGKPPEGHREGVNATDDVVREAGQNR